MKTTNEKGSSGGVFFGFKADSMTRFHNSGCGSFNIGGYLAAKQQTRDKRGSRRISWQAWRRRDSRHVQLTYDNVSASVTRDFKIHAGKCVRTCRVAST